MPYLKASFFVVMKVIEGLSRGALRREQTGPVGGRRGGVCWNLPLWCFSGQIRCPSFNRRESWQNGDNSCQRKKIVFSTKDYDNTSC